MKYWLTLETDIYFNELNKKKLGSIKVEVSDLSLEFNNLKEAIKTAREKAIDYKQFVGDVIIVYSLIRLEYIIACGKKKGHKPNYSFQKWEIKNKDGVLHKRRLDAVSLRKGP